VADFLFAVALARNERLDAALLEARTDSARVIYHRMDFAVASALRKPDRLKNQTPFSAIGAAVDFDMATIERSGFRRLGWSGDAFDYLLPDAFFAPAGEAIIDGLARTVFFGAILPAATDLQNMHDPAQNAPIILASGSGLVNRQVRNDFHPLRITEPKQVRVHDRGPNRFTKPLSQNMVNQALTPGASINNREP
jgi:hypothetical protein